MQGLDFALKYSQMIFSRLICFIFILLSLTQAYGAFCVDQVNGRKPHFDYVDHRLTLKQDERYYLGGGFFTNVWLVFDRVQHKWTVLKKYRFFNGPNGPFEPPAFLNSDYRAATLLKILSDDHPFRIPEFKKRSDDPHALELDYTAGKTLEALLADSKFDQEKKKALLLTFRKATQTLSVAAKRRHYSLSFKEVVNQFNPSEKYETLLIKVKTITGEEISIWIKPDNIIVDPFTLEMVLIDPH